MVNRLGSFNFLIHITNAERLRAIAMIAMAPSVIISGSANLNCWLVIARSRLCVRLCNRRCCRGRYFPTSISFGNSSFEGDAIAAVAVDAMTKIITQKQIKLIAAGT